MRILIIGGSRFVGPLVVKKLLRKGHTLTVFNRGHISQEYPKGVRFVKGDRNSGFPFKERFDAVIDMCAYNGSQTVRAINELKFDFFAHISTAAVYPIRNNTSLASRPVRGVTSNRAAVDYRSEEFPERSRTEIFPFAEESSLGDWPIWGEYGKGKVECENVLAESKIKYSSIRPVYILGPKNYCDRENFIYARIKRGAPIILSGNGEALTQFVFAEEVAETLAFLAEKRIAGIFNCAGDEAITLKGLAEEMGKIMGRKPTLKYNLAADGANFNVSEFPFANQNLLVNNEKLKKLGLTFTPILEGLKRDYESYYRHVV